MAEVRCQRFNTFNQHYFLRSLLLLLYRRIFIPKGFRDTKYSCSRTLYVVSWKAQHLPWKFLKSSSCLGIYSVYLWNSDLYNHWDYCWARVDISLVFPLFSRLLKDVCILVFDDHHQGHPNVRILSSPQQDGLWNKSKIIDCADLWRFTRLSWALPCINCKF